MKIWTIVAIEAGEIVETAVALTSFDAAAIAERMREDVATVVLDLHQIDTEE